MSRATRYRGVLVATIFFACLLLLIIVKTSNLGMTRGLRSTPFQLPLAETMNTSTKSELPREVHPTSSSTTPSLSLSSTIKLVPVPKCVQTEANVSLLGKRLERCDFAADDIFITIKTTQKNHKSRVLVLLLTWLQTVRPEQVII